jgi:hypothetical protein
MLVLPDRGSQENVLFFFILFEMKAEDLIKKLWDNIS